MYEGPLRTNVKSVKTSILVLKVIQGHCFRCQALSRTVSEIWPVIGSKSQNFPTASHLGSSIGVTPMEFWKSVTDPETRVFGAADGEDSMILACTVFA